MTRDIPSSQWAAFLDDFSRTHRAWLATADSVSADDKANVAAIERPLRSVSPRTRANRIVGLDIRFQENSEARSTLQILAPVAIRADETAAGTTRAVEIVDAEAGCTRIRFRAAPPSEVLDGIAPGEFPTG